MRAMLFVSMTNKYVTKVCEFRYSHSKVIGAQRKKDNFIKGGVVKRQFQLVRISLNVHIVNAFYVIQLDFEIVYPSQQMFRFYS